MINTHGTADYVSFMNWFEQKHPGLWNAYGKCIIAPIDGEGVTVEKDGMSMDTYKALVEITREYYRHENIG